MISDEKFEHIAEALTGTLPWLEDKLSFCRVNPPDPAEQPITSAIVASYIARLEQLLTDIRGGGQGLKIQFLERPGLITEVREFESWITRRKPGVPRRKLTPAQEDDLGDWFVSKMGYSYSRTRQRVRDMRRFLSGQGAPTKHPETLKMMDARIAHHLSYSQLAARMCDCGGKDHGEHCSERIRKRLKELESFLVKYQIRIPEENSR